MNEQERKVMKQALRKAFILGSTYWQQADWEKADVTLASFNELVETTITAIEAETAQGREPIGHLLMGPKQDFVTTGAAGDLEINV